MKNFTLQPRHLSNLVLGDVNDIFRRQINALLLDPDTGLSDIIKPEQEVKIAGLNLACIREAVRLVVSGRKTEDDAGADLYTMFDTSANTSTTDAFEYCLEVQRAVAALLKAE